MMVGRNLLDIQEGKEGAGLAIRDDDGGVRVFFFVASILLTSMI